jgi:hypothetical protein
VNLKSSTKPAEVQNYSSLKFITTMQTIELAKQVKAVRDARKKFLAMNENGNVNAFKQLDTCKNLEKELDKTLDELLKPTEDKNQIPLFK